MRIHVAIYYNGFVLALTGAFMLLSAGIGLIYSDGSAGILAISGLITGVCGLVPMRFIEHRTDVSLRESIFVVAFGWISCCLAATLPFYLYGPPFTLLDALFEGVSGFTTTGASILRSVEDLPKGLLFWRSVTHWLGGVGIVAFALTVMPRMGQVSKSFLSQEYSGLGAPPGAARAKDIARGLFAIYTGLTLAETILLMTTGMGWFDAVTSSFATIATGGFSVRNSSIATYNNLSVEIIIMVFMVLGGMNFVFMQGLLTRPRNTRSGWEVAKFYLIILALTALFTTSMIHGTVYQSWGEACRYGTFQVITVATSTGFGTADSSVWPLPAKIAITIITILGACAGSTGGAIKADRIMLYFKLLRFRFMQLVHPNIVSIIRVDEKIVSLQNVERAAFYITVYIAVLCLSTLLLSALNVSSVDAFTGSAACMGNVGPGMGSIGTMENYAHIPPAGKGILMLMMLLGRLEVFALVLPFTPGFWRT